MNRRLPTTTLLLCTGILCSTVRAAQDSDTMVAEDTSAVDTAISDSGHGAATESDKVYDELDKIVVTATRTRRRMSQTPASVSVIGREQIESVPARNMDDLIDNEASVQMKRSVGMGEGVPSDIIMRAIPGGFAASRTLILVDGIPTNASGTPFLILNEIPLSAIERIEVVRGPHSSLYGANAFGGVINVVTRTGHGAAGVDLLLETSWPFSALHHGLVNDQPPGESLDRGRREGLWHGGITGSGGNERLHYLASVGHRSIGNYLLSDSAMVRAVHNDTVVFKKADNHDYTDTRFFGKAGYYFTDKLWLTLHARYFDSELGFGRTKKVVPDSVDIVTAGSKMLVGPELSYRPAEWLHLRLGGFYRSLTGEFWNEDIDMGTMLHVPSFWRSASHDWQLASRGTARLGEHHTVTAGLEFLSNRIRFGATVNPAEGDTLKQGAQNGIHNIAAFLQDEMTLPFGVNIVPGLRFDRHSEFGGAVSPKLGIAWSMTGWLRFRSSIGSAFRAPTLAELYLPAMRIDSDFELLPNASLQPERLWAADIGVELMPFATLRLRANGFHNWLRDLVIPAVDIDAVYQGTARIDQSTGAFPVTHQNTTRAWSQGVELEADWRHRDWLVASAGYVVQRSRDEEATAARRFVVDNGKLPPSAAKNVSLDFIPSQSANLALRGLWKLEHTRIEGSLTQAWVGERAYLEWSAVDTARFALRLTGGRFEPVIAPPEVLLAAYFRTDVGLTITWRDRWWLGLDMQNLFNAAYEESGSTRAPGRFMVLRAGTTLSSGPGDRE